MLTIKSEDKSKIEKKADQALRGYNLPPLLEAARALEAAMCFLPAGDRLAERLYIIAERLGKHEQYTQHSLEAYLFAINKANPRSDLERIAIAGFNRIFKAAVADPNRRSSVGMALEAPTQPSSNFKFYWQAMARFQALGDGPKVPSKKPGSGCANLKRDLM